MVKELLKKEFEAKSKEFEKESKRLSKRLKDFLEEMFNENIEVVVGDSRTELHFYEEDSKSWPTTIEIYHPRPFLTRDKKDDEIKMKISLNRSGSIELDDLRDEENKKTYLPVIAAIQVYGYVAQEFSRFAFNRESKFFLMIEDAPKKLWALSRKMNNASWELEKIKSQEMKKERAQAIEQFYDLLEEEQFFQLKEAQYKSSRETWIRFSIVRVTKVSRKTVKYIGYRYGDEDTIYNVVERRVSKDDFFDMTREATKIDRPKVINKFD